MWKILNSMGPAGIGRTEMDVPLSQIDPEPPDGSADSGRSSREKRTPHSAVLPETVSSCILAQRRT